MVTGLSSGPIVARRSAVHHQPRQAGDDEADVIGTTVGQADDRPANGHPSHLGHMHVHGPDCGHEPVPHGAHVDYRHDTHRHAGHDTHYDEH